mmetsp:Transcript_64020/g.198201  ORF Transcript_64020/g.198201 Transcript_64020/m.198201 type:complete len:270 (-) Transcript_64020:68-877(-)
MAPPSLDRGLRMLGEDLVHKLDCTVYEATRDALEQAPDLRGWPAGGNLHRGAHAQARPQPEPLAPRLARALLLLFLRQRRARPKLWSAPRHQGPRSEHVGLHGPLQRRMRQRRIVHSNHEAAVARLCHADVLRADPEEAQEVLVVWVRELQVTLKLGVVRALHVVVPRGGRGAIPRLHRVGNYARLAPREVLPTPAVVGALPRLLPTAPAQWQQVARFAAAVHPSLCEPAALVAPDQGRRAVHGPQLVVGPEPLNPAAVCRGVGVHGRA